MNIPLTMVVFFIGWFITGWNLMNSNLQMAMLGMAISVFSIAWNHKWEDH